MNAGLRNYAIVTSAYWGFTLTDGALRMLVLLHFYKLGFSPFTLAFLFPVSYTHLTLPTTPYV